MATEGRKQVIVYDSNLKKLKNKPNSTDQLNKPCSQPINE